MWWVASYSLSLLQSTLPRGERPGGFLKCFRVEPASIHAPARGATTQHTPRRLRLLASIHAPARGATPDDSVRDQDALASIHAPARGATGALASNPIRSKCFNPRSRAGSDRSAARRWGRPACFNPRSRAGSDRPWPAILPPWPGFNPRSRAGSDPVRAYTALSLPQLQSTLPRGERRLAERISLTAGKLQSTLPRGERPAWRKHHAHPYPGFNPRSRAGSDPGRWTRLLLCVCFNPRSRAGSDCDADFTWHSAVCQPRFEDGVNLEQRYRICSKEKIFKLTISAYYEIEHRPGKTCALQVLANTQPIPRTPPFSRCQACTVSDQSRHAAQCRLIKGSTIPADHRRAWPPHARHGFSSWLQENKIASCPYPDPCTPTDARARRPIGRGPPDIRIPKTAPVAPNFRSAGQSCANGDVPRHPACSRHNLPEPA